MSKHAIINRKILLYNGFTCFPRTCTYPFTQNTRSFTSAQSPFTLQSILFILTATLDGTLTRNFNNFSRFSSTKVAHLSFRDAREIPLNGAARKEKRQKKNATSLRRKILSQETMNCYAARVLQSTRLFDQASRSAT